MAEALNLSIGDTLSRQCSCFWLEDAADLQELSLDCRIQDVIESLGTEQEIGAQRLHECATPRADFDELEGDELTDCLANGRSPNV